MSEETTNLFEEELKNEEAESEDDEVIEDEEDSEYEQGKPIESEDLSFKPKGQKEFAKISLEEEFPKDGLVLTIEKVELQPVYSTDVALKSKFGSYYKKKVVISFSEMFNDRKLKEFYPSVFYNIRNGKAVPTIPAACKDEELTDNFTCKLAKIRHLYQVAFSVDEKESDADFIKNLIGKKVLAIKKVGTWKDEGEQKKYAELVIQKFIV